MSTYEALPHVHEGADGTRYDCAWNDLLRVREREYGAVESCADCGQPLGWRGGMPPGPSGYWEHVDPWAGRTCAEERGAREIRPDLDREPWCNHDAIAVVDGVCECGTRV